MIRSRGWIAARFALFTAVAAAALAQAQAMTDGSSFINSQDVKWGDAPPSLPKGAKVAVLQGDPGKAGPFVIRIESPAGYKVPPHWHSQDEYLTVISGTFYLGMGDKMETGKAHALAAGGFHYLPGKAHHYAFSKGKSVIQVNGTGPFDINYINPEDDPQKAKH